MESVDNEEETEQVVLELFMCVVVLYQGSSFREISDPKMFCHELTVYKADQIATYFVKWLGKSTPAFSYGLVLSEALIAPAMPNTTARAGGIFLPIIKSLTFSWK
ncbi:hypothetical protein AABB24_015882 [Solanum stoloniferum]|uniref:Uncharacterized protein n=2 Tax=Solanum TaxID=4107 RepID=A0AAF0UKU9_SOLVR|nr:hypothetical protein MTR67_040469 [Solanum verrucosum]